MTEPITPPEQLQPVPVQESDELGPEPPDGHGEDGEDDGD